MSYNNEIAEGRELHEINGREYSVVGNTVYKKSLFGDWNEVEDEDEEAEAGNRQERNGAEYSRVGNTVYKKKFFGGWEELEDCEQDETGNEYSPNNYEADYDASYYSDSSVADNSSCYKSASGENNSFAITLKIIIIIIAIILGDLLIFWFIANWKIILAIVIVVMEIKWAEFINHRLFEKISEDNTKIPCDATQYFNEGITF